MRTRRLVAFVVAVWAVGFGPVGRVSRVDAAVHTDRVFEGTVGNAPVVVILEPSSNDSLSGAYFYRNVGRDIPLAGKESAFGEIDPNLTVNFDGHVTAKWLGTMTAAGFTGTWTATSPSTAKSLPVALHAVAFEPTNRIATVRVSTLKAKSANGPGTYGLPVVSGTKPDWIGTRIMGDFTALALQDESFASVVSNFETNGLGITSLGTTVEYNGRSNGYGRDRHGAGDLFHINEGCGVSSRLRFSARCRNAWTEW